MNSSIPTYINSWSILPHLYPAHFPQPSNLKHQDSLFKSRDTTMIKVMMNTAVSNVTYTVSIHISLIVSSFKKIFFSPIEDPNKAHTLHLMSDIFHFPSSVGSCLCFLPLQLFVEEIGAGQIELSKLSCPQAGFCWLYPHGVLCHGPLSPLFPETDI